MPAETAETKAVKSVPLTISQREEMLGAIIVAAGGRVGYSNNGATTVFTLPSGAQRTFSGNENVDKIAASLELDISEIPNESTPMGAVALWKARAIIFDILNTVPLERSHVGFLELPAAIKNEIHERQIEANVVDENLWPKLLNTPGSYMPLVAIMATPFDKKLRTNWANQVLSSLDSLGVEFLPRDVAGQIKQSATPINVQDVQQMITELAAVAASKRVPARRFVNSIHARLFRRGVSLGIEGGEPPCSKPAFMDYDVLRALTKSYMTACRSGDFNVNYLSAAQSVWDRNAKGLPLTLEDCFNEHATYLKNILVTRQRIATKDPSFPAEIFQSLDGIITEMDKPLGGGDGLPEMILRNQIAAGYGVSSIYSNDPLFREKSYMALQGAVGNVRREHDNQVKYEEVLTPFRQKIRETYHQTIALLTERDMPALLALVEQQWQMAFPGGEVAPGIPAVKVDDVFVEFQRESIETLVSKVSFKLREHWLAIKPMEQELLQDTKNDWPKIINAIKNFDAKEVPADYLGALRSIRVLFALDSLATDLLHLKQKEKVLIANDRSLAPEASKNTSITPDAMAVAAGVVDDPKVQLRAMADQLHTMVALEGGDPHSLERELALVCDVDDPKTMLREMASRMDAMVASINSSPQDPQEQVAAMLQGLTGRTINFVDVTDSVTPPNVIDGEVAPSAPSELTPVLNSQVAQGLDVAEPVEHKAVTKPKKAKKPPVKNAKADLEPLETGPETVVKPDEKADEAILSAVISESPVEQAPSDDQNIYSTLREALLGQYDHIFELAFDKNDELKHPDELDLFINHWDSRIGDVEQLNDDDLALAYKRAGELYGAVVTSKTSRALKLWGEKIADYVIATDELKATKMRTFAVTPVEYLPLVVKAWDRHFSFVADETGAVAEWAPQEQVSTLVKQARLFAEVVAERDVDGWKAWKERFESATNEYAEAKVAWCGRAATAEEQGKKLAAYWEMLHESMNWLEVRDIAPAVKSMIHMSNDDAAFEQLCGLDSESERVKPWLLPLDEPKQALSYVRPEEVIVPASAPCGLPSNDLVAAQRPRMRG